jgi:MFS family permease
VGYYTGIIVRISIHLLGERDASDNVRKTSLHFAAEALTTLHWSRLSDRIGRKPVLLSCLAGTIVSMLLFGLSRSFWAILLRCASSLHSLSLPNYVIR